ncbi:hypothetical protein [Terasakiella pusilla]|uniref:hypothetical protein n=1 Tax=Terasakiella pusilla TaxID=64973 RepID=UPI003AA8EB48
MGEAKRKRLKLQQDLLLSKEISLARFNLYALGTRLSMARIMAYELSWWSCLNENLIGTVFLDTTDDDYGWILLARDRVGRFRCVKVEASLRSQEYATIGLRTAIAYSVQNEDVSELGFQADEPNEPFDLLRVPADADQSKLHPYFKELIDRPGRAPARAVIKEIGPWLAPSDPHFVNEFQFKQFDQRLWELYLWATFRELGFDIKQLEAPDFKCRAPGIDFTVEATTISPSQTGPLAEHPNPKNTEEMKAFLADYMPMKFGSALMSKLNKKDAQGRHYWEREETADKPFVLAIADFHKRAEQDQPASMTFSHSALWPYLYGHRIEWKMEDGELSTYAVKTDTHDYKTKTIPSGFFDLPGTENVSAVLFSNAGTIAKFDRMGVVAGFAAPDHHYQRIGFRFNPDPNALNGIPFADNVAAPEYIEGWSDELQIFHNPNARVPLSHEWLSGLSQFYFSEGQQYSIIPDHHVWASMTLMTKIIK